MPTRRAKNQYRKYYTIERLVELSNSPKCNPLQLKCEIVPRVVKPFVFDPYHYNRDGSKKLVPGLADDPPEVLKNRRYMQLQKKFEAKKKQMPVKCRVSKFGAGGGLGGKSADGWNRAVTKKRRGSGMAGRGGSHFGVGQIVRTRDGNQGMKPMFKSHAIAGKKPQQEKLPPPPGARKPSQFAFQAAKAHNTLYQQGAAEICNPIKRGSQVKRGSGAVGGGRGGAIRGDGRRSRGRGRGGRGT